MEHIRISGSPRHGGWRGKPLLLLLIVAVLSSGCGSTMPKNSGKREVDVPPGVSPQVALVADSLASGLFVSVNNERKADDLSTQAARHWSASDSLWSVIDSAKAGRLTVSAKDSAQAVWQQQSGYREVSKAEPLLREYDKTQQQGLIIQASYHLEQARLALEKAVQLDPFNKSAQNLLALIYQNLATRFPREMSYEKALHIWGTLARLEPGEYQYCYKLAETYYLQNEWQQAMENFRKAEDILVNSAEVSPERLRDPDQPVSAVIDSTTLFYAIWYQGQCASRQFDAPQALAHLQRAWNLTRDAAHRQAIESSIAWINWDDGNIRASVLRDTANALANRADRLAEQGNPDAARKLYKQATDGQEQLLSMVKTTRARHETEWTLAYIESPHLGRQAAAVTRLLALVESIPKDTLGAPADTTYRNYFDTYGTMCHNLGMDKLNSDRRLAYTYFLQATTIHWRGRAKSFLMLSELSNSNPRQMVDYAERSLNLAEQLAPDEMVRLHKFLVDGYRRLRDVNKARIYFEKLRTLQHDVADGRAGK